jgi:hypothetical protein
MTAEQAMEEIWSVACPDCGPQDYKFIVREVAQLAAEADRLRVVSDGRR